MQDLIHLLGDKYAEYKQNNQNNENLDRCNLNIGSGATAWPGWWCYDALVSPGITQCDFDEDTRFALENETLDLVYSSHCFEHLPDETVNRLLNETYRVLKPGGNIVIKLPDFDWFLQRFKENDQSCMNGKGIEKIIWSWENFGISDCVENRVSMMFCGYWNKQYGDEFSRNINRTKTAYHGPARLPITEVRELFSDLPMRAIKNQLINGVKVDNEFKAFNHQNCWSVIDFASVLKDKNFKIQSLSSEAIRTNFRVIIPDIDFMGDWSMFFHASK